MWMFIGIFLFIVVVVIGLWIISYGILLSRAGEKGWGSVVPVYNAYLLCKVVYGNGWYFLLFLIPFGNILMWFKTICLFSDSYGRGIGFGILMSIFPFICMPILAFNRRFIYLGHTCGISPRFIVVCLIVFVLISIPTGFLYKNKSSGNKYGDKILVVNEEKDLSRVKYSIPINGSEARDLNNIGVSDNTVEGFSDYRFVSLSNENISVEVPIFNNEYSYFSGNYASGSIGGVSVDLELLDIDIKSKDDLISELSTYIDESMLMCKSFNFYNDVVLEEPIVSDTSGVQKIDYTVELSGDYYTGSIVEKVENCEGYLLHTRVTIDRSLGEVTDKSLGELGELYGVKLSTVKNN